MMKTALLVIDVQMAFVHDDDAGAERSCPEASENIKLLLQTCRERGDMIIHIHHHADDRDDPFYTNSAGVEVQPFAKPLEGEKLVIKHVGSAFANNTLEADLRKADIDRLIVCGATANHCAESTARAGGDLGFDTIYVSDAVWAYGATSPNGVFHDAEQIHSITLTNLHGEFATVMPTSNILEL